MISERFYVTVDNLLNTVIKSYENECIIITVENKYEKYITNINKFSIGTFEFDKIELYNLFNEKSVNLTEYYLILTLKVNINENAKIYVERFKLEKVPKSEEKPINLFEWQNIEEVKYIQTIEYKNPNDKNSIQREYYYTVPVLPIQARYFRLNVLITGHMRKEYESAICVGVEKRFKTIRTILGYGGYTSTEVWLPVSDKFWLKLHEDCYFLKEPRLNFDTYQITMIIDAFV